MNTAPTSASAAPEPTGAMGRIIGAIFSPKKTFDSIAQKASWVAPIILITLISLVVTAFFSQRVGWRNFMERKIEESPSAQRRMEQVPADKREEVMEQQTKVAGIIGYVAATVAPIISAVLVAAILLGLFNLVLGSKMRFVTSLGIVAHAWVPFVLHGLLGLLIIFLKDPATVDIENLVASNPGAFLSSDSAKWLVTFLTTLDIFTFWSMALMAFGYSATNPKKVSVGKAFGTIFGAWLLYVLVKVGLTVVFS